MAELVRYTLDDGSQVLFESAGSQLVRRHGGEPEVSGGGRLTERLQAVAAARASVQPIPAERATVSGRAPCPAAR